MTWIITNLVIQIAFGILGGHVVAAITKDHNFGAIGHTIAGAIGGCLSGYFFQTLAATMVNGSGGLQTSSPAEQAIIQGLTGAVAGAIAVLIIGVIKHSIDQRKPQGR